MRAVRCIHCESEEVVKMGYQKKWDTEMQMQKLQKDISNRLCKQRSPTGNEKTNSKDVSKWKWNKRCIKSFGNKQRHGNES